MFYIVRIDSETKELEVRKTHTHTHTRQKLFYSSESLVRTLRNLLFVCFGVKWHMYRYACIHVSTRNEQENTNINAKVWIIITSKIKVSIFHSQPLCALSLIGCATVNYLVPMTLFHSIAFSYIVCRFTHSATCTYDVSHFVSRKIRMHAVEVSRFFEWHQIKRDFDNERGIGFAVIWFHRIGRCWYQICGKRLEWNASIDTRQWRGTKCWKYRTEIETWEI